MVRLIGKRSVERVEGIGVRCCFDSIDGAVIDG